MTLTAPAALGTLVARRRFPVLPLEQRHLVSRFSYGVTPALARQVRRAGGARAWLDRELAAPLEDVWGEQTLTWWPHLSQDPRTLWADHLSRRRRGFDVMFDHQRYALVRRVRAARQVREVMTEFWEQLLNVPTIGEPWFVFRTAYGQTLRRLAFSSYEEILRAAVLHPAMLVYLDNARSNATQPNENLARELLELHTVGRGAYGEDEVKSCARILTGWAVDTMDGNPSPTWNNDYQPSMHATGAVRVLDFRHPNAAADGRQMTLDFLRYLAHHPLTAQRLAARLVVKFVTDEPAPDLVDRLARVYLEEGTQVVPVLRALAASPEFADSVGAKVRDPAEDVVATYRVLQVQLQPPRQLTSAANAIVWQSRAIGLMPHAWPRPDGPPLDNRSWCNPARMLASYRVHHVLSGGYYPTADVRYRDRTAWMPPLPATFAQVVDHLSRQVLCRPASPALVQACGQLVGARPADRITGTHRVVTYAVPRLLLTVLDSPDHFLR